MTQSEFKARYVEFRRLITADLADRSKGDPGTFTFRRNLIHGFRLYLEMHAEQLLQSSPHYDSILRMGLKIPTKVNFRHTLINRLNRNVKSVLFDIVRRPRHLSRLKFGGVLVDLKVIKTFEGRRLVFRLLGRFKDIYYSPATDFCCLRLQIDSIADIENVSSPEETVFRSLYRLNIRQLVDMNELADLVPAGVSSEVLDVLIDLHVISTASEIALLNQIPRRFSQFSKQHDLVGFRKFVSALLPLGWTKMEMLHALNCTNYSNIDNFEGNIALLRQFGVKEIGQVFLHIHERLWNAAPRNWEFLLTTIAPVTPLQIAKFDDILCSKELPPPGLTQYLNTKCCSIEDLEQFLPIILKCKEDVHFCIERCETLLNAPFNAEILQLAKYDIYITAGDQNRFIEFSNILQLFSHTSARALSTFQYLYQNKIRIDIFRRLLQVAANSQFKGNKKNSQSWIVSYFKLHGNSDGITTLEYLIPVLKLETYDQFSSALPLCFLNIDLVRYLVENRKIGSLWSLLDWHRLHGKDVRKFWFANPCPDVSIALLDDASERNNFSFIVRNNNTIHSLIDQKIRAYFRTCMPKTKNELPFYDSNLFDQLERSMGEALVDELSAMLKASGGFLLRSFLVPKLASEIVDFNSVSKEFELTVNSLMDGFGPTNISLSHVDLDAIESVYMISPGVVSTYWEGVRNFESHIANLIRKPYYTVSWTLEEQASQKPADENLVSAIENALTLRQRFDSNAYSDIAQAVKGLRPRTQNDLSSDPITLSFHFAILIAICADDERIKFILTEFHEHRASLEDRRHNAYVLWHNLKALFISSLPDALADCAEQFIHGFSNADAQYLADRLIKFELSSTKFQDGHIALQSALRISRQIVTDTFSRAIFSELKKFNPTGNTSSSVGEFSVVISKHPAAFFSKSSAQLCTDRNTKMWVEDRHCHLLIFDREKKKLAGMAMIYIMWLPQISDHSKGLLIRAINPVNGAFDNFNVSSIVDSLLDVCIDIAKANQLEYVAIPNCPHTDIISNSSSVEDDVFKRYAKEKGGSKNSTAYRARINQPRYFDNHSARNLKDTQKTSFYAFEHGVKPVDDFLIVWRRSITVEVQASADTEPSLINQLT